MSINDTIGEYISIAPLVVKLNRANKACAGNIRIDRVDYGMDKEQYFLTFHPESNNKKSVLMYIHGGGWRHGSPEAFKFIGHHFAKQGYITILPGYRHLPEHRYPAQAEDIFTACREALLLLDNAGVEYDGVVVAGASAGAQLGGVLVYNREMQKEYDLDQGIFKGYCSIGGPLCFDRCKGRVIGRMLDKLFPESYDRENGEPYSLVKGNESIPVLCIHGERDPLIDKQNSVIFIDRINRYGKGLGELYIQREWNVYHSNLIAGMFLNNLTSSDVLDKWLDELDSYCVDGLQKQL